MRLKLCNLIKISVSILFALLLGAAAMLVWNAPVFEQGESYTFYLGANSSSLAVTSRCAVWDKLFTEHIAGESTCYLGDRYAELKEKYHAELLFEERVDGIYNYYLYSARLGDPVYLNGRAVNLHIAISEERTAVGTPIIFGGY